MDNRRRMMLAGGISADPVLENNDWATISKVARAGKAEEFWKVGDKITVIINGYKCYLRILDFDHDDVVDSAAYGRSKAGITFEMSNTFATKYPINSITSIDWSRCSLRANTLPTFKQNMPVDLRNAIVQVNKPTYLLAATSNHYFENVVDDLFLLSATEVFNSTSSKGPEGKQYAYYAAGKSKVKSSTAATSENWWLRSMPNGFTNQFSFVTNSGALSKNYVSENYGVSFAFCV